MIIEHYGVKGMRWGVRNDDGSNKHHKDNILNRLYSKVEDMYENDPDNPDRIFEFMDDIFDRRVKIGEISKEEADDPFAWLDDL